MFSIYINYAPIDFFFSGRGLAELTESTQYVFTMRELFHYAKQ